MRDVYSCIDVLYLYSLSCYNVIQTLWVLAFPSTPKFVFLLHVRRWKYIISLILLSAGHRMMLNHRILVMNDGLDRNVLKIKPPLCFNKDNANSLLKALEQILSELGH